MKGIFWLASYPKSGNTWVRAFLANLTSKDQQPVGINHLATGAIGSSREWVQEALGIEISELSHEEVDRLRPRAYQWIADHEKTNFHKIHDAYSYLQGDIPLIPHSATRGAVYLVRNPMDVAVSLAYHSNISIQAAVDHVCDPDMAFCHSKRRLPAQLRQLLMSWNGHVKSWLSADIPKRVCRYEDIQNKPEEHFSMIADFLEIKATQAEVDSAIQASCFKALRAQEDKHGFGEKTPGTEMFFRKGIVGDWRTQLTDTQVARIVDANAEMMEKMGYLGNRGNIMPLAGG